MEQGQKTLHGSLDYSGNFASYSGDHISYDFLTVKKFNYEKIYLNRFIKIVKESFTHTDGYSKLIELYDEYPKEGSKEALDKLALFYFKNYIDIYIAHLVYTKQFKYQLNIRSTDMSNSTKNVITDFIANNVDFDTINNMSVYWESYNYYMEDLDIATSSSDFEKQGKFNLENVVEKLNKKYGDVRNVI